MDSFFGSSTGPIIKTDDTQRITIPTEKTKAVDFSSSTNIIINDDTDKFSIHTVDSDKTDDFSGFNTSKKEKEKDKGYEKITKSSSSFSNLDDFAPFENIEKKEKSNNFDEDQYFSTGFETSGNDNEFDAYKEEQKEMKEDRRDDRRESKSRDRDRDDDYDTDRRGFGSSKSRGYDNQDYERYRNSGRDREDTFQSSRSRIDMSGTEDESSNIYMSPWNDAESEYFKEKTFKSEHDAKVFFLKALERMERKYDVRISKAVGMNTNFRELREEYRFNFKEIKKEYDLVFSKDLLKDSIFGIEQFTNNIITKKYPNISLEGYYEYFKEEVDKKNKYDKILEDINDDYGSASDYMNPIVLLTWGIGRSMGTYMFHKSIKDNASSMFSNMFGNQQSKQSQQQSQQFQQQYYNQYQPPQYNQYQQQQQQQQQYHNFQEQYHQQQMYERQRQQDLQQHFNTLNKGNQNAQNNGSSTVIKNMNANFDSQRSTFFPSGQSQSQQYLNQTQGQAQQAQQNQQPVMSIPSISINPIVDIPQPSHITMKVSEKPQPSISIPAVQISGPPIKVSDLMNFNNLSMNGQLPSQQEPPQQNQGPELINDILTQGINDIGLPQINNRSTQYRTDAIDINDKKFKKVDDDIDTLANTELLSASVKTSFSQAQTPAKKGRKPKESKETKSSKQAVELKW